VTHALFRLRERDPNLRELMDDPECDPVRLAATYRRFGLVNRLVAAWSIVYRHRLRTALAGLGRTARILDLGSGGGDVVVRLARLAARDGIAVEWIGADPDPRALEQAHLRSTPGVTFVQTTSTDLRQSGERFDAVISNHVLHHLDDAELSAFTDDSLALSRGPVLHGDIERNRVGYLLYSAGIVPLSRGTFLRTDGLRSIRRSYRAPELAARLGDAWAIERPAPFRLLAVGEGRA
jgi:2-polyprenyl-3-methyl-5-hydroxy-6-metoxy-1,4-benzoquinol methylase